MVRGHSVKLRRPMNYYSPYKLHADIVILSMDNVYSTIGKNMRYFKYNYKFSTNTWYRPLSFLNNKIDTYVNSTVNFDIVCTVTATKELFQARDMGDTQFFNRQELTIMIDALCKKIIFPHYVEVFASFFFISL